MYREAGMFVQLFALGKLGNLLVGLVPFAAVMSP